MSVHKLAIFEGYLIFFFMWENYTNCNLGCLAKNFVNLKFTSFWTFNSNIKDNKHSRFFGLNGVKKLGLFMYMTNLNSVVFKNASQKLNLMRQAKRSRGNTNTFHLRRLISTPCLSYSWFSPTFFISFPHSWFAINEYS